MMMELLERISDEDLKGEALDEEIKRSVAAGDIAKNILAYKNFQLRITQAKDAAIAPDKFKLPESLEG
jgi:hypothetical protein